MPCLYIITDNPMPNGMAATERIKCYAKAATQQGISCEIDIYHRTEVYGRPPRNTEGNGEIDGYRFHYIHNTPLRGTNVFSRRLADWADKVRTVGYLSKRLRRDDTLLLYASEEKTLTRMLAMLAHWRGTPIIRELCEYPYGYVDETPFTRIRARWYLRTFFHHFDGAICISEALYQLAKKHHPKGKYLKLPIMVKERTDIEPYQNDRPYIFHGGTMTERKDAIVSTMKAFAQASHEIDNGLDFILAGPKSPHEKELEEIIRTNGLQDHVRFLPLLSHDESLRYQKGAFLTILNKNDNLQNQHGFSTKLGEVLISGTPVITTTVGEANHWLKDGFSAYIVKPGSPDEIAAKIVQAYRNDQERKTIADEGRQVAAQYFNTAYQGQRLKQFFDELHEQ